MGRKRKSESLVQIQRVRTRDKNDEKVFNFQEWREEQERYDETGIADPDVLGDEKDAPDARIIDKEFKERYDKMLKKAKQILTERQYQVFELIGVEALTFRKAAKVLSKELNQPMGISTIQSIWEAARDKLAKSYV